MRACPRRPCVGLPCRDAGSVHVSPASRPRTCASGVSPAVPRLHRGAEARAAVPLDAGPSTLLCRQ
eukprot:6241239-Prorocentrum_lima.AAC.1